MKAVQIVELSGPEAVVLADVPPPDSPPSHPLSPGAGVLVEVHAAGVSFPEVLQSRGLYQLKPPLPFVPGSEIAGIVREASPGAGVKEGERVAAFCVLGAFAELAVAPGFLAYPLPDELDFAQGASLILNYH
ncbi:MAG TPA: alcohol dehydrogenase catalytic domain-containing protein, partial [Solirubrobacteraceae bacterium]|nr:alcohol dehydrogenase catalytic domain-containing protein [Solirubrobacteraceae bacterium]